jgi:hypothetical protein
MLHLVSIGEAVERERFSFATEQHGDVNPALARCEVTLCRPRLSPASTHQAVR